MTNVSEKMNYLISHAKADVNLAAVCFQMIKNAPSDAQAGMLEEFFIGYKSMPTTGDLKLPMTISNEEERKYMLRYGKLVDTHMEELQKQNLPEKEFYSQLWKFICESPVLPNEKARIIALFDCAIDKRLPYFMLDRENALSMENEEYQEICKQLGETVFSKLEYVLNADFDQKTEQASLVVQMLDNIKDYNQRCVFVSRIISHYMHELLRMKLKMSIDSLVDD